MSICWEITHGILSDDATFHRTAKEGSQRLSLYKNEEDSIVVSEQGDCKVDNDGDKKSSDKEKKSFEENETLEAIFGIVFAAYDWVWIAINIRSEAVTQDPIAIFMGIVVPLMASIGLCYMHGLFIYELVLGYVMKRQKQSKAFQNKSCGKQDEITSTIEKTERTADKSTEQNLDTSNKM